MHDNHAQNGSNLNFCTPGCTNDDVQDILCMVQKLQAKMYMHNLTSSQ